jgi:glycosyltransferase involved in cell wall biosynthesis
MVTAWILSFCGVRESCSAIIPPQVRIVDLGARRIREALMPLVRYLHSSRPDALQALMWPVTVLAVFARMIARVRTRLVVADHTTLSRQYAHLGRGGSLFLRCSVRMFYPMAEARVAVSQDAAADLAELGNIERTCIDVIYNPVADPPRSRVYPEVEALWGVPRGRRILTVGNLKEEKQHASLVRSFAAMEGSETAKLIIVGSGPLDRELRQVAADAGVADRVLFPGFTIDPWPYYCTADLFVLSSRFEGYGWCSWRLEVRTPDRQHKLPERAAGDPRRRPLRSLGPRGR